MIPRALAWPFVWLWHWFVRYQRYETANWIRACERDGLLSSRSLREARGQRAAYECRVIELQHWLWPVERPTGRAPTPSPTKGTA